MWPIANPGETGEMIGIARAQSAAVDLTDQAVWIPTSVPPDGPPLMNVPDLPKPHCILVDGAGRRFVDEAQSYMANGQDFYTHGAVPAHAIMAASYFRQYSWGFRMGAVPKVWQDSGFLKYAPTLRELAEKRTVDHERLDATVAS